MNDIIMEIIKIEEKAREISEVAKSESQKLSGRLKEFYKQVDEQISSETQDEIQKQATAIKDDTNEKLKEIYDEREKRVELLKKQYEESKDNLSKDVFNRIVGRC